MKLIKKSPGYNVDYAVDDKKKKDNFTWFNYVCFAMLTNRSSFKGEYIRYKLSHPSYSNEDCKKFHKILTKTWGLRFDYNDFLVTIDGDVCNRNEVMLILVLMRYLEHQGFDCLIEVAYNIKKKHKTITFLEAFQIAHFGMSKPPFSYVNTNHTLRSSYVSGLFTVEELLQKIKNYSTKGKWSMTQFFAKPTNANDITVKEQYNLGNFLDVKRLINEK